MIEVGAQFEFTDELCEKMETSRIRPEDLRNKNHRGKTRIIALSLDRVSFIFLNRDPNSQTSWVISSALLRQHLTENPVATHCKRW